MEKKIVFFMFAFLLFLEEFFLVSAINLEITPKPVSNAVVADLGEPAVFDLWLKNLEAKEKFEIYSLIGIDISHEPFIIDKEETKKIRIQLMPQDFLKTKKGPLTFEYIIKNSKNEIQRGTLTINIIDLEDAFYIIPESIEPKKEKTIVSIRNRLTINFSELNMRFTSAFFEHEETISLDNLETKEIELPLDAEKLRELNAGNYLMNVGGKTRGKSFNKELIIKFLEMEGKETDETEEGTIIKRYEIVKKNVGNTRKSVEVTAKKNLLSYLFTTVNIEPTETEVKGFVKYYSWKKELIPNEELKIIVKTNWYYPIIIIIFAIALFILIKNSVERDLSLRKKVSYIKTKGGEFALKVVLKIKSKKFLERINIIDKLPPLVKLYQRYGAITPDKIDLKNRRIEWNIESLNKDEERIFTYIIYSKIGVVGRFELPAAKVIYEKEGKLKEAFSNRSFFISNREP